MLHELSSSCLLFRYGSFFNYWFIESGGPVSAGIKADANKAGFEGRALMPSIWSGRLRPELQPILQVHPSVKLTASAWAEPCGSPHNPCGNFGTNVATPQGQVRWPPPRISVGCLIHAVILNGGPYAVPAWNASIQIPSACQCSRHVNMTYLFRGKDPQAGRGVPILLNLTAQSDNHKLLLASFTEYNIAPYGSAILQINCSVAPDEGSLASPAGAQLVINPSFELDLGDRPELVGSLCTNAPIMWMADVTDANPDGIGTQDTAPINPAMPARTLPEWTAYPVIRPEFGISRSGRSSAKVMNSDIEHARVCVPLTRGADPTLPPGMIAGRRYTVHLAARVAPSSGSIRFVAIRFTRMDFGTHKLLTNSYTITTG